MEFEDLTRNLTTLTVDHKAEKKLTAIQNATKILATQCCYLVSGEGVGVRVRVRVGVRVRRRRNALSLPHTACSQSASPTAT